MSGRDGEKCGLDRCFGHSKVDLRRAKEEHGENEVLGGGEGEGEVIPVPRIGFACSP